MPKDTCIICKRNRAGKHNRQLDAFVCTACYNRELRPRRLCVVCGQPGLANAFTDEGKPICAVCYRVRVHLQVCSRCGEHRDIAHRMRDGRVICSTCYVNNRAPRETCKVGGQLRPAITAGPMVLPHAVPATWRTSDRERHVVPVEKFGS